MFHAKRLEQVAARIAARDAERELLFVEVDPGRIPRLDPVTFTAKNFELAVSPDSSYSFLEEAISSARKELLLYIYNISAPYLLQLLRDRVEHGVRMRIMYDTHDTGSAERKALNTLGAEVREAPSSGARSVFSPCHQKMMVIDGQSAVVGSANWATSSIPKPATSGQYKMGNREWLIRIGDKAVAKWFRDFFNADWNIPETRGVALERVPPPGIGPASAMLDVMRIPSRRFPSRSISATAQVRPILCPTNYLPDVKALLSSAKRSIYLQQQYIKAGAGVNELMKVVAKKSATCDVRIIGTTKFPEAWQDTIDTVSAAGLLDRLRALNLAYFVHCHNKGIVVDRKRVVVCSTNWSSDSIHRAREAGVIVESTEIAGYYADVFEFDWDEGIPASQAKQVMMEIHPADTH